MELGGDLTDRGFHVGKIGLAAGRLRRAYGDKDHLRLAGRGQQVGGKHQAAPPVPRQQFRQLVLINGNFARLQSFHLFPVIVHADYGVTDLGKTRRGNQSNIAGADDRNS